MISKLILSASIISSANALIYIVSPDIDNYKRKSDQVFYDTYQNPNSAIKTNDELKIYTDAIPTTQRLFEGDTIRKVSQGVVLGDRVPAGATAQVTIMGLPYTIGADIEGNVFVNGQFSDGKQIKRKGDNAFVSTPASCISNSKYGCIKYSRGAQEGYLDISSGLSVIASVSQTRNFSCSKYGCNPTSPWATSNLNSIDRKNLKWHEILKENVPDSHIISK